MGFFVGSTLFHNTMEIKHFCSPEAWWGDFCILMDQGRRRCVTASGGTFFWKIHQELYEKYEIFDKSFCYIKQILVLTWDFNGVGCLCRFGWNCSMTGWFLGNFPWKKMLKLRIYFAFRPAKQGAKQINVHPILTLSMQGCSGLFFF